MIPPKFTRLASALFACCALSATVHAQVVVLSNLAHTPQSSTQVKLGQYIAESFHTSAGTSYALNSVSLQLNDALATGGGFFVRIVSGTTKPFDNADLNVTLTGNADPATAGLYTFTANTLVLAPDTTYWIVAGVQSGTANYRWFFPTASTADVATWSYGPSFAASTHQDAGPWTTFAIPASAPAMYSITATAIPEPATYAMLAGIGGLGLALRRRLTLQR